MFFRYFYGPIEGTQFSLGLAFPERYGLHEFMSQEEIRHSQVNGKKKFINFFLTKFNLKSLNFLITLMCIVTEYFKGSNWKVHPDFVYCEYNSLKDMDKELENSGESYFRDREDSFDTPEEQVLHFMARAGRPGWKWMSVSFTKNNLKTI
jgi:hypothetical protein